MIINKNGTKINDNEIEYFVRGYNNVYLYITYNKGNEDSIVISFKVKNTNVDDNYYILVTGSPDRLHQFEYTIKQTGNIVLQCPIPEGTYYCLVSIKYNGGIQSLHGDVTITLTTNATL